MENIDNKKNKVDVPTWQDVIPLAQDIDSWATRVGAIAVIQTLSKVSGGNNENLNLRNNLLVKENILATQEGGVTAGIGLLAIAILLILSFNPLIKSYARANKYIDYQAIPTKVAIVQVSIMIAAVTTTMLSVPFTSALFYFIMSPFGISLLFVCTTVMIVINIIKSSVFPVPRNWVEKFMFIALAIVSITISVMIFDHIWNSYSDKRFLSAITLIITSVVCPVICMITYAFAYVFNDKK
ncbi:hypothetical protein [Paracoccus sp. JM45]|uniref:hypothetical protein n=1 Tax=Paracoccus sp. JM45 TaxID=2283626 RepID=UPI0011C3B26A|nr:hypothetical protein [Paracoccus sp. JM45]